MGVEILIDMVFMGKVVFERVSNVHVIEGRGFYSERIEMQKLCGRSVPGMLE